MKRMRVWLKKGSALLLCIAMLVTSVDVNVWAMEAGEGSASAEAEALQNDSMDTASDDGQQLDGETSSEDASEMTEEVNGEFPDAADGADADEAAETDADEVAEADEAETDVPEEDAETDSDASYADAGAVEHTVSFSDISWEGPGYAAVKICFTFNNPDLVSVSKVEIIEEIDEQEYVLNEDKYGDYSRKTKVVTAKPAVLLTAGGANSIKLKATLGDGTTVESTPITVAAKELKEEMLEIGSLEVTGTTAAIRAGIRPECWQETDDQYLYLTMYYKKKTDSTWSWVSRESLYLDNLYAGNFIAKGLDPETEYEWRMEFQSRANVNGKSQYILIKALEGETFTTGAENRISKSEFDATLFRALQLELSDASEDLSASALAALDSLTIDAKAGTGLESLNGIEHLKHLEELRIYEQTWTEISVEDIDRLSALPKLRILLLDNNWLEKMPDLTKCVHLSTIQLACNFLTKNETEETLLQKLPENFRLREGYLWARHTMWSQRQGSGEIEVITAPEYYFLGNSYPFQMEFTNLLEHGAYKLSVTIDGTKFDENSSDASGPDHARWSFFVTNITGITPGAKEVAYTLTDIFHENKVIKAGTVNCTFVKEERVNKSYLSLRDYTGITSYYYTYEAILDADEYNRLGTVSKLVMKKTGSTEEKEISDVYCGDTYTPHDGRYDQFFLRNLISYYSAKYISARFNLQDTVFSAGTYDVEIVGSDGRITLEGALEVVDAAVVTGLETVLSSVGVEVDQSDGYYYVRLIGKGIDPTKVHPVFKDPASGKAVLDFVKSINLKDSGNIAGDAVTYQYKTNENWPQISGGEYYRVRWELEVEEGYDCCDCADKHTAAFEHSQDKRDIMFYYNYKTGTLDVRMKSNVPQGAQVTVKLTNGRMNGTTITPDTWIYATGTGEVDEEQWLKVKLKDKEGHDYVPDPEVSYTLQFSFHDETLAADIVWNSSTGMDGVIPLYNDSHTGAGGSVYFLGRHHTSRILWSI